MKDPFAPVTAEELADIRRYRCEICGRTATQRHHALIRRDRHRPELDVLINLQLVCHVCHTGTGVADSRINRLNFYNKQCDRYGKSVVDGWMDGLGYKYHPDI